VKSYSTKKLPQDVYSIRSLSFVVFGYCPNPLPSVFAKCGHWWRASVGSKPLLSSGIVPNHKRYPNKKSEQQSDMSFRNRLHYWNRHLGCYFVHIDWKWSHLVYSLWFLCSYGSGTARSTHNLRSRLSHLGELKQLSVTRTHSRYSPWHADLNKARTEAALMNHFVSLVPLLGVLRHSKVKTFSVPILANRY